MVVVHRLVGLPASSHDVVHERDAALDEPIGELEVMEGGDALHCADLVGAAALQP